MDLAVLMVLGLGAGEHCTGNKKKDTTGERTDTSSSYALPAGSVKKSTSC